MVKIIILVCATLCTLQAHAKVYLGLDLGKDDLSAVQAKLAMDDSNYDTNYGYKGYTNLLLPIRL